MRSLSRTRIAYRVPARAALLEMTELTAMRTVADELSWVTSHKFRKTTATILEDATRGWLVCSVKKFIPPQLKAGTTGHSVLPRQSFDRSSQLQPNRPKQIGRQPAHIAMLP